ncbi:MAG: S8 family peptidase [Gemmatimonadaceae bacterium]
MALNSVPSDPFFSLQYYLKNTVVAFGVPIDDSVEAAWDINEGGEVPSSGGMVVAVIGTGVEAIHPDFGDHVEFGYDATSESDDTLNCSDCASNPSQSHGTSVAGIIVAQHNTIGVAGIAPDAIVEPIKILQSSGTGADLDAADGINFAWATLRAQILNKSWGFSDPSFRSQAVTDAVNNATTHGRGGLGAVVVFSAGNTSARSRGIVGPVLYPALLPASISVSAIDHTGALTDYSPHGKIDLVAPSSHFTAECHVGDLVTTDLAGSPGCSDGPGGNLDYTTTFGGTSAAAPQVSAAVALLLTKEPTLTLAQVKSRLSGGANGLGSTADVGVGKLDIYHTLVSRPTVTISGLGVINVPGTYTWTAVAAHGNGTYAYHWDESIKGGAFFDTGIHTASFSSVVVKGDNFTLRVTVTSGPDQVMATHGVLGPGGTCTSTKAAPGTANPQFVVC